MHPIKSSVVFFIISHLSIILQLFIVLFYILFEGQNSCGQEVISLDTILRLRELMNSRGWSEYRLAKESKLSMSTISNIFHRGSIPSIPTLETLCNTFGISLGQFFSKGVSFKWSKQKFVCGKIMVKRKITAKLAVIFRLTTTIPRTVENPDHFQIRRRGAKQLTVCGFSFYVSAGAASYALTSS